MADIKLSQLGVITTLADEDLVLVSQSIDDGGFISKAITVADLKTEIGSTGSTQVGIIEIWALDTPPSGYLECNGSAVSRVTYADLFALIGGDYGNGNGSTTFTLPEYRGKFLRGWAHGKGSDPNKDSRTNRGDGTTGDNVGTKQGFSIQSHNHFVREYSGHEGNITFSHINSKTNANSGDRTESTGNAETRPKNVNVMYIIKT